MTKRDFSTVIIKLLGVYVIIKALPYMASFINLFQILQQNNDPLGTVGLILLTLLPLLIVLIIGTTIISKSNWFAAKLFKDDSELGIKTDFNASDLQTMLFTAIGLFIALSAIPDLFRIISMAIYTHAYSNVMNERFVLDMTSTLPVIIAKLILGSILFLKARGLSNLWKRIQVAKYEKITTDSNNPNT